VPNPTSWIVSHLTLDPGTGYFRLYVFDYYYDMIALKPIWGWGFADTIGDDDFLGKTTLDNVWLVCAVRFGIPIIVLLLMTNIGTFYRSAPRIEGGAADPYINSLGTGFTASIICFCIIGLTVHYWNAIWILWGVCLGVRAAIKESQVWPQANPARTRGSWHRQVRNVL
jgi:O-antigen ligase